MVKIKEGVGMRTIENKREEGRKKGRKEGKEGGGKGCEVVFSVSC